MSHDSHDSWPDLVHEREAHLLAPYALHSADSRGRAHEEPEHSYRGPFQRDRDRILHCAAFRRLSGKMQVFTGDMGDYHRTRLTHTMEVASIARTICRALRLHEDFVEALALLHDIGHPPFGHAGEEALHACLVEEGGFSHNAYALTLVEQLECRPATYPGLNLTYEVRAGQRSRVNKGDQPRLLEVQIVDVADSITYTAHDVDDALKLGLVTLDQLRRCELMAQLLGRITAHHGELAPGPLRRALVHDLIDCQVTSVLQKTLPELKRKDWSTAQEALASGYQISPATELAAQLAMLQQFLYEHVYRHATLLRVRQQAQNQIRELFAYFVRHPGSLPPAFQRRAESVGLSRSAADFLAGMTDRFCRRTFDQMMSGQ